MGNFLFQAAATIGYAKQHGLDFTVPVKPTDRRYPVYLPHLVNANYDPSFPTVTLKEKVFHHHEIEFREEWRHGHNIVLDGYWQSEKYFKEIRDDILKLFAFRWSSKPGVVSVHVRRGDYLRWREKHPPVGAEWIQRAMDGFQGYRFRFFSDDIPWCKKMFGHQKHCSFSEGQNEISDLEEMSSCEHHVCSASTYSWWGAYLDRNVFKKVVIPRLWFVPGWNNVDPKDIVPSEWIKLP